MKVVVSSRAYRDLHRIYLFSAERNQSAAEALAAEMRQRFQNLANFPFLGRARPDLGPDVRRLTVGKHLIFYRTEQNKILILRVIDGRMDVEAEFRR
ncbi:MAG: type II toxin-antitoxin system RelE/ParE family toxin [Methylocystis sp.]|nr:type II toxin-antitoxin system RelE/ParE family toxin [Methylocystis sp.]MBI3274751.1 type II toxin-antitoxin system RelE/ParE family toxin [Methylocystis sp.]